MLPRVTQLHCCPLVKTRSQDQDVILNISFVFVKAYMVALAEGVVQWKDCLIASGNETIFDLMILLSLVP